MKKKVSIILCTFNEVNHIGQTIDLVSKTLKDVEIVIIDDNSKDGTIEKLEKLKSSYKFKLLIRKNERGLATAQKKGFEISSGDYVGTIDANNSDQILYFSDLILQLDNGYDIAVLSRYIKGGDDKRIFIRSFASKILNKLSKIILGIPFNDFSSCIFLMKKELLTPTSHIIKGYAEWFIEFIYVLHKKGYKIKEIPYIQKIDDEQIKSKSYPNILSFFYLGSKYFLRACLAKIRN